MRFGGRFDRGRFETGRYGGGRFGSGQRFSPTQLFPSGSVGLWFDPSDHSTLFQDIAGTIPAQSAGDPVALMLDKSQGMQPGPELWGGQLPAISNYLSSDGQYDAVTRTMSNSVGGGNGAHPRFNFDLGATVGKLYRVEIQFAGDYSQISQIRMATSGSANDLPLPDTSGRLQGYAVAGSGFLGINVDGPANPSITIVSISVREIRGNHAIQNGPSSSRPKLQPNGNGTWHLSFDGDNDFLVVDDLDLTATDTVTAMWSGQVDITQRMILEFSTAAGSSSPGSYYLFATGSGYQARSAGTSVASAQSGAGTATGAAVLTQRMKIGSDELSLRKNGSPLVSASQDHGSGNFGQYPLFLGSRGGTGLFMQGFMNELLIVNQDLNAPDISSSEEYLMRKFAIVA